MPLFVPRDGINQASPARLAKRCVLMWQMAAASASPVSKAQSGLTPSIRPTMKLTCSLSAAPTPTSAFLMTEGS